MNDYLRQENKSLQVTISLELNLIRPLHSSDISYTLIYETFYFQGSFNLQFILPYFSHRKTLFFEYNFNFLNYHIFSI